MLLRTLVPLLMVLLAACTQPQQLNLYSASVETRLFANPVGFQFPDGVSLEQTFDRESGALLSSDDAADVARSVIILPPAGPFGRMVTACEHTWRHAFVFYDAEGAALGALAYCMECGAVQVVGPEDPQVTLDRIRYDGAELDRIVRSHGLMVEPEYPE